MERVSDTQANQLNNLRHAFDVQISEEAENLEEKLHDIRISNEIRVNTEKRIGEEEIIKIKTANQQKLQEYRKNSDEQTEKLRKDLQATTTILHEQAKKAAKRERVDHE